ncbi:MAG: beta-propeller domain-containing protein [Candidatus Peribacteraceae bacterium]|nr:beta-propeller domain-containing protein [Candidatus Peribacteraceae bacterium]MDD5742579.1 beta-propeller domain-containing protein [Candidatus Peribacteraceae bacterium]
MRTLRRVFSSVLIGAVFLVSAPSVSFALVFQDVRPGVTPYAAAIESLKASGVIEGYSDGTFKPSATVNRAEFLKIILESRGWSFLGQNCFPDVRDEWFASYVCAAKEEGIVSGYPDGSFKPEQTITFVEAAKILSLAYGQQVQSGGEWYAGYARALESSKAIPPSVAGLTNAVTRGEMAEMMWRLTAGVTDQPTQAFLNVKYPSLAINLASEQPQTAKSCADLAAFAEESQQTGTLRYRGGMMIEDKVLPTGAIPPQTAKASEAQQSGDYSRTNVQVAGVDEADIVKTDGTYLYAVQDDLIRIIRAEPASAMEVVSMIDLQDSSFTPSELYLDGDRLVVTGSVWKEQPYGIMQKVMPGLYPYPSSRQRTQVRLYDVSDRANPKLSRELEFDGSLVSSRRIGDRMYLVMNQGFHWVGPMPLYRETDVLPSYQDSALGDGDRPVSKCADVTILPHVPQPEYLIVAVVPLANATAEVQKEVIVGSAQNLYVSPENLYVAATEWSYFWRDGTGSSAEQTHLYRFALTSDGVTFKAKGTVPGHVLNQFSMDEHGQTFRVATTEGQTWESANPSSSNLFVLNLDLEQAGSITDIAPGEQIYSVRFMGDRTYMVTFKNTDPFFVIDTSDPRNPRIIGKLKIPGYSNYLHPYDENHILGFGKEAEDSKEGNFAWYQGMKVALFDVTDPGNPVEMSKVVIGDRGTQSPLLNNHKALLFDRSRNLLAFPVSVAKISDAAKQQGSWDFPSYGDTVFQGAYVYNVDLQSGLTLRGTVTHYGEDDVLKAGSYLYGKDIERIVRIGDALLTVGQDRVVSSDERMLTQQGQVLY